MLLGPAFPALAVGAFLVAVLIGVLVHKAVHKVRRRTT